jgi:Fe-S-cluster containining protein
MSGPLTKKTLADLEKNTKTINIDIATDSELTTNIKPTANLIDNNNCILAHPKNKYYIPTLYINDPTLWVPQPREKRRMFTSEVAEQTCLGNCCGVEGLKAACCYIDTNDLEHVLGPVEEEWIKNIIRWFNKKDIYYKRSNIVIDFDEGTYIGENFFNGHQVFQSRQSYPMMRMQVVGPRMACIFLNTETGRCTIYHQRSDMCVFYYCQYCKTNFSLKELEETKFLRKIKKYGINK